MSASGEISDAFEKGFNHGFAGFRKLALELVAQLGLPEGDPPAHVKQLMATQSKEHIMRCAAGATSNIIEKALQDASVADLDSGARTNVNGFNWLVEGVTDMLIPLDNSAATPDYWKQRHSCKHSDTDD